MKEDLVEKGNAFSHAWNKRGLNDNQDAFEVPYEMISIESLNELLYSLT